MTICKATTKAGKPCRNPTWGTSEYCLMHDPSPEAKEIMDQGRAKGRSHKVAFPAESPSNIGDAVNILSRLVGELVQEGAKPNDLVNAISNYLKAVEMQDTTPKLPSELNGIRIVLDISIEGIEYELVSVNQEALDIISSLFGEPEEIEFIIDGKSDETS